MAIRAALENNWEMAITYNLGLLKADKDNINSLNRLGFAYIKSGKIKEAKKTLLKVKSIDEYNLIALKNLARINSLEESPIEESTETHVISPMQFLEDPGKTKVAQCVNVAPTRIISSVHCGQEVYLKVKNHNIEIRDQKQRYLGALPDDLSFRLMKLLEGKNTYAVFIKSVEKNSLSVIVREISRGKRFEHQPSFVAIGNYQTFSRDAAVETDKPDVTPTGEEDTDNKNESE